jgi:hypothetical protein
MTDPLETLWDDLLSRDQELVRAAFGTLSAEEQKSVLAHLQRMVNEPGWQPEQRLSALAALDALEPTKPDTYFY